MAHHPILSSLCAVAALSLGSVLAHAAQPAPVENRKTNEPSRAPEHQPQPPARSDERAAEALNKRDRQEIEARRRGGDDDPETRDGVRIESTPDHRGENDGKN